MKKIVMVFVMILVSATFVFAAEEKSEGWKPYAEISAAVHNAYVDEYSGEKLYDKTLFFQALEFGLDKKEEMGFYVRVENFQPSEKTESEETDFYVDVYAKFFGCKMDIGLGHYWIRESKTIDFNSVYAEITLPAPFWGITPFIKGEYRFAEKEKLEDGSEVSLNGFVYYGGLSKEFEIIPERLKVVAEISLGGNTGIYDMPAENLSFAREKVEIEISLTEWLKLKASALTQQNLGKEEGIAADTDKLLVSGGVSLNF